MVGNSNSLHITQIHIKNFRCFSQTTLELDWPVILIEGINGSGKTSLLEALHYLCYLRSFRTHTPRDLIRFGQDGFFIKADFNNQVADQVLYNQIQVGFSGKKRLVKVNDQSVSSYKELIDHFRIVTLTEDDLALINQGPDCRRSFIDQAILLSSPDFITTMRSFKHIVDSRNSMLMQGNYDQELYRLWTEQLWATSRLIIARRKDLLREIEQETNALLTTYFGEHIVVSFAYAAKKRHDEDNFDDFINSNSQMGSDELRFGRSLFGAHLDDITIKFQDKKSKAFASRGQQKLIILLVKIAQIKRLATCKGASIFLLDDFMTDFDQERAEILLSILTDLRTQLIFTCPTQRSFFQEQLLEKGCRQVLLTI